MYTLTVRRDFIARHYLIGGDWGDENRPHEHRYAIELRLEGATLDEHGYLADIDEIGRQLEALVARYHGQLLNDLPEFAGLNPSIEHFCRIACERLSAGIGAANVSGVTARIWENEIAWAGYRLERA